MAKVKADLGEFEIDLSVEPLRRGTKRLVKIEVSLAESKLTCCITVAEARNLAGVLENVAGLAEMMR